MTNKLINIATFYDSNEAALYKTLLEAQGISAFLFDDCMADYFWYLRTTIGGIKLKVLQSDVEEAIDFLTATNIESSETIASDEDRLPELSWDDEILDGAFRTAVLGVFFIPLQFWSILLLIILLSRWRFSPSRSWKVLVALLLNMLLFVMLFWSLASLFI